MSPRPPLPGHLEWIHWGPNDLEVVAHSCLGEKRVDDENYLPGEVYLRNDARVVRATTVVVAVHIHLCGIGTRSNYSL